MRNRSRLFSLFLVLMVLVFGSAAYTVSAQGVQVTTTTEINLRSTAQADSAVIAVIPSGTKLPAIGRNASSSRIQVTYGQKTGWVSAQFVTKSGDLNGLPVTDGQAASQAGGNTAPAGGVIGTVGPNGLSVRQQASSTSKRLGFLAGGTKVSLTGRQGNGGSLWVRFSYQGQDAWLAGWLLTISGDVNTLPNIAPAPTAPTSDNNGKSGTLIIENQLGISLHIVVQGPTGIDVNMGPNTTQSFTVAPGTYLLLASAEDHEQVSRTETIAAGGQFTWTLVGG